MSEDTAVFAKGTKLELSDGETPPGYSEVMGVTSWAPDPGGAGDPEKLDATSGSTSGLVREKIDGYSDKRPGVVPITFFYNGADTVHQALYAASIAGTDLDFKITIPTKTGTEIRTFTARLSGFPIDIPFDKLIQVKTTLNVKEGTWAAGA